jgi:hypothetical protein
MMTDVRIDEVNAINATKIVIQDGIVLVSSAPNIPYQFSCLHHFPPFLQLAEGVKRLLTTSAEEMWVSFSCMRKVHFQRKLTFRLQSLYNHAIQLFRGVLLAVALDLGAGLVLEGAQPLQAVVVGATAAPVPALGHVHVPALVEEAIRLAMHLSRARSGDQ